MTVPLTEGKPSLADALHPGWSAYIDADWIPDDEVDVAPALVRTPSGTLSFAGLSVSTPRDVSADDAAAAVLEAVVQSVLEVVAGAGGGHVEVIGRGIVAAGVREAVGATDERALDIVVDATGDPTVVAGALAQLRDQGTLVLVGERAGRTGGLDLYPDLHRRGLRLIGVPRPLVVLPAAWRPAPRFEAPQVLRLGEPPAGAARWFRVDA